MKPLNPISGFSLIEVVATIGLLAILAAVSTQIVTGNVNAQRYEETRKKMELIRAAILGDEALDSKGQRFRFGFLGDMGTMPTNLTDLTTIAAQPAWAMDTRYGIGAGWRGSYYLDKFTTAAAIGVDAWGTNFSWTPTGTPTLTSFGSDKASGTTVGDVYSNDLTMVFSSAMRLGSVRGFVRDGDTRIPNAIVRLRYPAAGAITTYETTSAADGSFAFQTIPYGHRAIAVSSVPTTGLVEVGPKQIAVAGPQFLVPNFLMNYFGDKQKITVGVAAPAAAGDNVTVDLNSSYEALQSIDYITVNWTSGTSAFIENVQLGAGGSQAVTGLGGVNCAPSARRIGQFAGGQDVAANTLNTTLTLTFSANADCTGSLAAALTSTDFYVQIEWLESKETDVFSFHVPPLTPTNLKGAWPIYRDKTRN